MGLSAIAWASPLGTTTCAIFIDLLWDALGPRAYNWQTAGERFENDVKFSAWAAADTGRQ